MANMSDLNEKFALTGADIFHTRGQSGIDNQIKFSNLKSDSLSLDDSNKLATSKAIKTLSDATTVSINALTILVNSIEARVTVNEADIATNTGNISSLLSDVSTLNSRVNQGVKTTDTPAFISVQETGKAETQIRDETTTGAGDTWTDTFNTTKSGMIYLHVKRISGATLLATVRVSFVRGGTEFFFFDDQIQAESWLAFPITPNVAGDTYKIYFLNQNVSIVDYELYKIT